MKVWKYVAIVFAGLLVLAQWFQPEAIPVNSTWQDAFFSAYPAPPDVKKAFLQGCVNCHGGAASYRWYASLVPLNYFGTRTVQQSQQALDFSTFMELPKEQRMEYWDLCTEMMHNTSIEKHCHSYWLSTPQLDKAVVQAIHHWASSISEYEEHLEAEAMSEE